MFENAGYVLLTRYTCAVFLLAVSASETPYLLLGSDNQVVKINILDLTKVAANIHTERDGVKIRGNNRLSPVLR